MWDVKVLTFFPELFPGPLGISVLGRALNNGLWKIEASNIRDYAIDKHKTVDDKPYGGGCGMVVRPDVLGCGIDKFFDHSSPIYYPSPRGRVFNQAMAMEMVKKKGGNFICGRFEGVDERIFLEYNIHEVSVGDFILSCGDIAAYSILDSCVRLIPGVLKDSLAIEEESFASSGQYNGLLEYPHYTKPYEWRGMKPPDVLRSGNHAHIKQWRLEQAVEKTKNVRPDLMDRCIIGGKNEFIKKV